MLLYYERVGRALCRARKAAHMTLKEVSDRCFAEKAPLDVNVLSRIENGSRRLTFDEALLLLEIFKVDIADFVADI